MSWTSPINPTAAGSWVRASTWSNTATNVTLEPISEKISPVHSNRKSRERSGERSTASPRA